MWACMGVHGVRDMIFEGIVADAAWNVDQDLLISIKISLGIVNTYSSSNSSLRCPSYWSYSHLHTIKIWHRKPYFHNFLCIRRYPTIIVRHYGDVLMGTIVSQITSLTIVYSTVYSDADQRKHLSTASLAFVWGIHRGPVNSPHKWPVTRKMFPFDDVIMT